MIAEVRARSSSSLHVNVFCHRPPQADAALEGAWLEQLRPHFEKFGARPPEQLKEIYRSFLEDDAMLIALVAAKPRVVLVASATNVAEGRAAARAGMHAVVAQGYEAGGHRGTFDPEAQDDRLGTIALTHLLVRTLDVPVIAAGGIMDGAGIAAVLRLGAAAAQLGTAFISCPESEADAGYRAALASDAAHHTIMTRAISGRLARCLANSFTALGAGVADRQIPAYPIAYDAGKALNAAAKAAGDTRFGAQWAGQGAPLARALPAAELVATLAREMR